jgi:hypothetical protein
MAWRDAHPERCQEYQDRYVRSHPDRVKESKKRYNEANTEKVRMIKRRYEAENRDKVLESHRESNKRSLDKLRCETFAAYGGPKCACCGEDNPKFLTMDHVNNDGAKHRRETPDISGGLGLHRWLRRNGYPPGFQVLCYNCNLGKSRNKGVCPHLQEEPC